MQRALLNVLVFNGTATIDDVRDLVQLPIGVPPKLFGAVPKPLVKSGIISGKDLPQRVGRRCMLGH